MSGAFLHSRICLVGMHRDNSYCRRRPGICYPSCIQSQNVTKNIAVSNNAPQLEGAVTNLPHAAKAVKEGDDLVVILWKLARIRPGATQGGQSKELFVIHARTSHRSHKFSDFRGYFYFFLEQG